jgi:hypothetical protein
MWLLLRTDRKTKPAIIRKQPITIKRRENPTPLFLISQSLKKPAPDPDMLSGLKNTEEYQPCNSKEI